LTGAGTYNQGVITGTTNYVECQSNIQTNKTGAVILEAPAPTSLSIEMKGAGIQAIFLGLLLQ
jgi:hypothetical protein